MTTLDIILLVPLAYFAYKGFVKGFIITFAMLAGLLLGLYAAIHFSEYSTTLLQEKLGFHSGNIRLISYLFTFVVVLVLVYLLGHFLTGVVKTTTSLPTTFSLSNAYPNQFNPTTNIQFSVAKSENVKLVVFNILGLKIKTLVNGEMKAGSYTATWNGKDEYGSSVASGINFYRLESQSFNSTKNMILMK